MSPLLLFLFWKRKYVSSSNIKKEKKKQKTPQKNKATTKRENKLNYLQTVKMF